MLKITYGAFGGGMILLALSLVLELFSRRAICSYLCPGGAFFSLLGKFRILRVKRNDSSCIQCVQCNQTCGLNLKPMTENLGMECNNCTACIASCPSNALSLKFTLR